MVAVVTYSYFLGRILAMKAGGNAAGRNRTVLALGAGLVLTALVGGAIALGGGSGEPAPVPAACVEAWNSDREAVAYGTHNFGSHGYTEARVGRLDAGAEPAGDDGLCSVTFPALTLDPEPAAAGQVLRDGRWTPISQLPGVELTRVAELQAAAAGASNAVLAPDGRLSAGG